MQHAVEDSVEEGLLAEPVARQQDLAPIQIAHREREHPVQMIDAVLAVLFVCVDDGFGVGVRTEDVALSRQRLLQLAMVVDLAVEDNPDGSILVGERLRAAGAIDDGQPSVRERDPRPRKIPFAVRAAMGNPSRHRRDGCLDRWIEIAIEADDTADTAHGSHSCTIVS